MQLDASCNLIAFGQCNQRRYNRDNLGFAYQPFPRPLLPCQLNNDGHQSAGSFASQSSSKTAQCGRASLANFIIYPKTTGPSGVHFCRLRLGPTCVVLDMRFSLKTSGYSSRSSYDSRQNIQNEPLVLNLPTRCNCHFPPFFTL